MARGGASWSDVGARADGWEGGLGLDWAMEEEVRHLGGPEEAKDFLRWRAVERELRAHEEPLITEVEPDGRPATAGVPACGELPLFEDADGDVAHSFLEEAPGTEGLVELQQLRRHETPEARRRRAEDEWEWRRQRRAAELTSSPMDHAMRVRRMREERRLRAQSRAEALQEDLHNDPLIVELGEDLVSEFPPGPSLEPPLFEDEDGDVAHAFLVQRPGEPGLVELQGLRPHTPAQEKDPSASRSAPSRWLEPPGPASPQGRRVECAEERPGAASPDEPRRPHCDEAAEAGEEGKAPGVEVDHAPQDGSPEGPLILELPSGLAAALRRPQALAGPLFVDEDGDVASAFLEDVAGVPGLVERRGLRRAGAGEAGGQRSSCSQQRSGSRGDGAAPEEPLIVEVGEEGSGSAACLQLGGLLFEDEDGDIAHEFLEEMPGAAGFVSLCGLRRYEGLVDATILFGKKPEDHPAVDGVDDGNDMEAYTWEAVHDRPPAAKIDPCEALWDRPPAAKVDPRPGAAVLGEEEPPPPVNSGCRGLGRAEAALPEVCKDEEPPPLVTSGCRGLDEAEASLPEGCKEETLPSTTPQTDDAAEVDAESWQGRSAERASSPSTGIEPTSMDEECWELAVSMGSAEPKAAATKHRTKGMVRSYHREKREREQAQIRKQLEERHLQQMQEERERSERAQRALLGAVDKNLELKVQRAMMEDQQQREQQERDRSQDAEQQARARAGFTLQEASLAATCEQRKEQKRRLLEERRRKQLDFQRADEEPAPLAARQPQPVPTAAEAQSQLPATVMSNGKSNSNPQSQREAGISSGAHPDGSEAWSQLPGTVESDGQSISQPQREPSISSGACPDGSKEPAPAPPPQATSAGVSPDRAPSAGAGGSVTPRTQFFDMAEPADDQQECMSSGSGEDTLPGTSSEHVLQGQSCATEEDTSAPGRNDFDEFRTEFFSMDGPDISDDENFLGPAKEKEYILTEEETLRGTDGEQSAEGRSFAAEEDRVPAPGRNEDDDLRKEFFSMAGPDISDDEDFAGPSQAKDLPKKPPERPRVHFDLSQSTEHFFIGSEPETEEEEPMLEESSDEDDWNIEDGQRREEERLRFEEERWWGMSDSESPEASSGSQADAPEEAAAPLPSYADLMASLGAEEEEDFATEDLYGSGLGTSKSSTAPAHAADSDAAAAAGASAAHGAAAQRHPPQINGLWESFPISIDDDDEPLTPPGARASSMPAASSSRSTPHIPTAPPASGASLPPPRREPAAPWAPDLAADDWEGPAPVPSAADGGRTLEAPPAPKGRDRASAEQAESAPPEAPDTGQAAEAGAERPEPEIPETWEVVGGSTTGGVLVRKGEDLSSRCAKPSRLKNGAIVRMVELVGSRLHFELLSGDGPKTGWVSIKAKDRVLLVKREAGAETPTPSVPRPRSKEAEVVHRDKEEEAKAEVTMAKQSSMKQPAVPSSGPLPPQANWARPPAAKGPEPPDIFSAITSLTSAAPVKDSRTRPPGTFATLSEEMAPQACRERFEKQRQGDFNRLQELGFEVVEV